MPQPSGSLACQSRANRGQRGGLPPLLLQAKAAGVPVVAVEAGRDGEALGGYGRLVPPDDEAARAAALADALDGTLEGQLPAAARAAQPTSKWTPWASGMSQLQLMVLVCRRM